ncbi:MAG: response regulator [Bryobacteraceae bacterium]
MFQILVVDDDAAFVHLLRRVIADSSLPCELQWAKDGADALDFLWRRPPYGSAPAPDLILMDMNMPRVSGLEALRAIKSDPELRAMPVIMLSTNASPASVLEIYRAGANCFVAKAAELDRFKDLLRAIETFWMDFAILPSYDGAAASPGDKGRSLAGAPWEVGSQAMFIDEPNTRVAAATGNLRCEEHCRLMEEFAVTVKELLALHEQQFEAIVQGDPECNRFDLLIHMANEKKQQSKYAYLRHVESHGCSNLNAITNSSGT